jgi:hypothetical protein
MPAVYVDPGQIVRLPAVYVDPGQIVRLQQMIHLIRSRPEMGLYVHLSPEECLRIYYESESET